MGDPGIVGERCFTAPLKVLHTSVRAWEKITLEALLSIHNPFSFRHTIRATRLLFSQLLETFTWKKGNDGRKRANRKEERMRRRTTAMNKFSVSTLSTSLRSITGALKVTRRHFRFSDFTCFIVKIMKESRTKVCVDTRKFFYLNSQHTKILQNHLKYPIILQLNSVRSKSKSIFLHIFYISVLSHGRT